jgi:hypothetical protein
LGALGLDGRPRGQRAGHADAIWHQLLQQAAGLAGDDGLSWDAVARSAAHLKRLGHIDWSYIPTPNVDRPEPPLEFVDSAFLQRVQGIRVTDKGHAALATRQKADSGTQINIVNSTVFHS